MNKLFVFLATLGVAFSVSAQGPTRFVNTIADLQLIDPDAASVSGSLAYTVAGRTTVGDWGTPRVLRYVAGSVAAVDDGCIFATLASGRWIADDCSGAALDPRWFGAVPDDPNDDTIALQATIDAIGTRASMYLPQGVYNITNTLYVTNNAVTIRGNGPDSSTIWMRSNGPAMYVGFPGFDGGFNDYSRHQFVLEDFGVRGVDGVTNQVGIQVSAASRVALNRVFAETFGDEHEKGFFFDRWSWWISVQNCKTYNCWIGLLASGNTTNVNIPENSFNAVDFSGNTFRSGRYGMILGDPLYSPDTPLLPTAYAVGIRNSSFENFGELGVWIASPWNCIVDNNYIENNPIGVRIGATNWTSRVYDQAKNVAIKNNHIYTLTNSASAGLVLQDEKTCVQIQGGLFATIKENHFMGYKRAAVEIQSTGVKQTAVDGNGYYNYAEIPRVIGPFTNGVAGNSFFHRWLGESWVGSGTNGPDNLINNIVIDGSTNLFRAQVVLTNKPLQFLHGSNDWKLSKFLDENRGLFHGGFSVSNGGINLLSTNGAGYALAYKRDYDPAQRTVIPQDGTLRFSDGTFDPDVGIGYAGAAGWIRLWTNIQGYGHASFGPNPSIWGGSSKYGDRGIYHTSTDPSARPEVLIGYLDGVTNQRVSMSVSNRIGIISSLASLSGSEMRFMVDDQHAATMTNSGLILPSGKSLTIGGESLTDISGTNLIVAGNKLNVYGLGALAFLNAAPTNNTLYGISNGVWAIPVTPATPAAPTYSIGLTNSGTTIYGNYKPGANMTATTNGTEVTFEAIVAAPGTNSYQISVDGTLITTPNLQDSVGVLVNSSGTNINITLTDRDFGDITVTDSGETMVIDNGSVTTNKVDSTFYNWVLSQAGGQVNVDGTAVTNIKTSADIAFTTGSSEATPALTTTAVSPGSYSNATITVDSKGRLTSASTTAQPQRTELSIDSAYMASANLADSAMISVTATGTNVTMTIPDGVITTNKVDSTFHGLLTGNIGKVRFRANPNAVSGSEVTDITAKGCISTVLWSNYASSLGCVYYDEYEIVISPALPSADYFVTIMVGGMIAAQVPYAGVRDNDDASYPLTTTGFKIWRSPTNPADSGLPCLDDGNWVTVLISNY